MKKLLACIVALTLVMSLGACEKSETKKKRMESSETIKKTETTETKNQVDSDFDEEDDDGVNENGYVIHADYELKAVSENGEIPDKEQVDKYVSICIEEAYAILNNDLDAFKQAANTELIGKIEDSISDSKIQEELDRYHEGFDENNITSEVLSRDITRVYFSIEYTDDAPDGYNAVSESEIALLFEDENGDRGYVLMFVIVDLDGEIVAEIDDLTYVSSDDISEMDYEFDHYDEKASLKTANSNAKTAYNIVAEYLADMETQGYSPDEVLYEEGGEIDCTSVSYSNKLSEKISEYFSEYDSGGMVYIGTFEDGFFVQWKAYSDSEVVGQYPNPNGDVNNQYTWGYYGNYQ